MIVVALVSQKGGTGKTTLCTNLAVAAEQAGRTTLLTDLDSQGSAIAWSNLRSASTPIVARKTPEELTDVLAIAERHQCDLVVLDTPAHSSAKELKTLRHADFAVIPCRTSATDLLAIGATIDLCQLAGVQACVVFTAAPVRSSLVSEAAAALQDYAVTIAPVVIHQRIAHVRAYAAGLAVLEHEPKGKAAAEVQELYNWINQQLRHIKHVKV